MLGDSGGREPDMYPHIEKRGDMYHCGMYGGKFDREAFELADGCPICASVEKAQQNVFGGL